MIGIWHAAGIGMLVLGPLPVLADGELAGDAVAGEAVFAKCMQCHEVGAGAEQKVGPVLNGVVGRVIASDADYAYSAALKELGAAGQVWTPETLSAFLEKPRRFAQGTKMSTFIGLRRATERDDVIAYLATFPKGGT